MQCEPTITPQNKPQPPHSHIDWPRSPMIAKAASSRALLGKWRNERRAHQGQSSEKEKENSFSSHSTEGASVPVLQGSQAPASIRWHIPPAPVTHFSITHRQEHAAPVKQIAVTISELKREKAMWGACWKKKALKRICMQPKKAFISVRALHMGWRCWRAEGHRQDRWVLSRGSGREDRQMGAHTAPLSSKQEPELLQLTVMPHCHADPTSLHPSQRDQIPTGT